MRVLDAATTFATGADPMFEDQRLGAGSANSIAQRPHHLEKLISPRSRELRSGGHMLLGNDEQVAVPQRCNRRDNRHSVGSANTATAESGVTLVAGLDFTALQLSAKRAGNLVTMADVLRIHSVNDMPLTGPYVCTHSGRPWPA